MSPIQETLEAPRRDPTHPDMRICEVCGQSYDMAKLADAHHHEPEPHDQRPAQMTLGTTPER